MLRIKGLVDKLGRLSRFTEVFPPTLIPASIYILVIFYYPLLRMLRLSIFDPDFTLDHYRHFITTPAYTIVLSNTIKISAANVAICLFLGYPLAYYLANKPPRIANRLMILVLLPFLISGLVRNYAWMVLLSSSGVINQTLMKIGLITSPLKLMFNRFGVLVGMTYINLPWMILPLYGVMRGIDPHLSRAADSLGAGPFRSFIRVYFPLSLPGVFAGSVLVFIYSLGFFVTPSILGGINEIMIAQLIEHHTSSLNWGFASASAVILLVVTFIPLIIGSKTLGFSRLVSSFATGDAATSSPTIVKNDTDGKKLFFMDKGLLNRSLTRNVKLSKVTSTSSLYLGKGSKKIRKILRKVFSIPVRAAIRIRWSILTVLGTFTLAFLIIPVFVVIPISFSSALYLTFPPPGFSLQWYEDYFAGTGWINPTIMSFIVATITMLIATILASLAAYAIVRKNFALKPSVYALLLSPLIIPEIITAISIYFIISRIGLIGTPLGLVIGHVVFALPPALVVLTAVLQNFDWDLERAALSLGANRIKVWSAVIFPIILPGLISAALFAFLRSFDELLMALFMSGVQAKTLPKRMWEGIREEINPTIAAVSTLLIVLYVSIMVIRELLERRSRSGTDRG